MSGSSPLARGTLGFPCVGIGHDGLIPARAGNTASPHAISSFVGAHPRSRGEHRALSIQNDFSQGSSPLARGTRVFDAHVAGGIGLIPARAGNTLGVRFPGDSLWAHPRSRGEHRRGPIRILCSWGSSPLARGTPGNHRLRWTRPGLIPARAGNTVHGRSGRWPPGAHPRSRGEHPRT